MDIVKRGFEPLRSGDVEALLPFVHPDFEMTTPSHLASEPDTYRGHDGVRRWFDSFYEVMHEVRLEADQFIAVGERVVVPTTLVARGKATGLEVSQPATLLWELRDEQAIGLEFFADVEEALARARELEGS